MRFSELHTTNTNFIIPPEPREFQSKYCPREEVIHPRKLDCLRQKRASDFRVYQHNENYYYVTTVPWVQTFKPYGQEVHSTHIYVLCQTPSLFCIPDSQDPSLKDWFDAHHNTLFLVSNDVLVDSKKARYVSSSDAKYVSLDNNANIMPGSDEELNIIINTKSYTIGNGLIFLLAMHRIGNIPSDVLIPILRDHNMIDYYQDVHNYWEQLYYDHPTNHIADFPLYYACAGPDFADAEVVSFFKETEELFINIMYNNFTSPQSVMYPHFSESHWNNHDQIAMWREWETPTVAILHGLIARIHGPDIRLMPDFAGIIQAFTHTDAAWNFWRSNCDTLVYVLFRKETKKRMMEFFKAAFYFYTYGKGKGKETEESNASDPTTDRIRIMWQLVLDMYMCEIKTSTMAVYLCVYSYITSYTHMDRVPVEFIQDVMIRCEREDVMRPITVGGTIRQSQLIEKIKTTFKDTHVETHTDMEDDETEYSYKISVSLFDVLKLDEQHKAYMQEIILARMHTLQEITKDYYKGYTVYRCVYEHMYRNRDLFW